jgi:ABC-type multidrug transport system fused ATPase/permease subunit
VALIYRGGIRVNSGAISQGQVVALVNYMSQILVELVKLANLIINCTKAVACGNRVADILKQESSLEYKETPVQPIAHAPRVEFRNVSLAYNGSKVNSIEHVNLTVMPGETVGIIGGTGSGKSTLVNLIPRFYDATEGELLVDGVNVKEYPKDQLRNKIGVVPQKAVLFKGTIEENLKWGKKDATEEEMQEALQIAQAKEFVDEKEGKLKFQLNQGAKNLSGGQKQRLTIARAVIRKPDILILDDSSSALDYATDAKLRNAIGQSTNGMTVFIVSQRSSSIRHANQIVVLDDGKVVGIGTHSKLVKECQVYREICLSQMSKEEVERS